jgi:hypothetical protein
MELLGTDLRKIPEAANQKNSNIELRSPTVVDPSSGEAIPVRIDGFDREKEWLEFAKSDGTRSLNDGYNTEKEWLEFQFAKSDGTRNI